MSYNGLILKLLKIHDEGDGLWSHKSLSSKPRPIIVTPRLILSIISPTVWLSF